MTAPINHDQLERDRRHAERDAQIAEIAARIKDDEAAQAEMRACGLRLIASSRISIRRRLLDVLDECQADHNEYRDENGLAVGEEKP